MAYPFRKVLAPIEFDDVNSLTALGLARQIAHRDGSLLILAHIVPLIIVPADVPVYRDVYAPQEVESKTRLQKLAREHLPGDMKYQVLVRVGDAARLIVDSARELGADLIVMATHGRRGLSHLFVGSVTERVVREAPCPVLTVRAEIAERGVVSERMTSDPVTVSPHDTLAVALDKIHRGGFRALPVVDGGRVMGVLDEVDIGRAKAPLDEAKVGGAMSPHFVTIGPSAPVEEAAELLLHHRPACLPVVDQGKLVGVITTSDILMAFVAKEADAKKPAR